MAETPDNNTLLEQDPDGRIYLAQLEPDGTKTRTATTTADALAYLDRQIAAYGADGVPIGALVPGDGGVMTRTLTRGELYDRLTYLVDRLRRENGADDAGTIAQVRDAIRSPKTVRVIAEDPRAADETVRAIWTELDQILAWVPGPADGGTTGGTGTAVAGGGQGGGGTGSGASATALAEAGGGTGQGAGPLPDTTPPAIVNFGAASNKTVAGGGGSAQDAARVGDPVLAFSGQLLIEATDLEVEGIGLDFQFSRTYLHATGYNGPLGPHWDHSYNLWLRESLEQLRDGSFEFAVYRSTGKLSAERFVASDVYDTAVDPTGVADLVLNAGDGNHDRLLKIGGRYRLITATGFTIDYSDALRAERLSDRNGNEVRLVWEGEEAPKLVRLVDTCGREFRFGYNEAGLLDGVHDQALDREIRYRYDADGRLERVLRSTVPGKHPQTVQAFRYWGDGAPRDFEANVLGILDARGREVLQIEYGEEPGFLSYNRVVAQRDGGVTRYGYGLVAEPDPDPGIDPINTAALRVEMTLPDGNVHVLDYTSRGHLVALALETPGLGRLVHRWRYNADGAVVSESRPDGGRVDYEYGRERYAAAGGDPASATPSDRARFGELRRVIERARPGAGGPPGRITEFDYHPVLALITERRGPYYATAAGNRIGSGPAFTLRITYDGDGNAIALRRPDCGRADGSTQTGFDIQLGLDARGRLLRRSLELEDGTVLATTFDYPPDGDPTAAYPLREVNDADGVASERRFVHDAGGRLRRLTEASGLVEERTYDLAGRLTRVLETGPDVSPSSVTTVWAPHDLPLRTTRTRADADGNDEPAATLVEEFDFDADGDVRASTVRSGDATVQRTVQFVYGPERRVRRMMQDGVTVEQFYDARGLVVRREVRAPGVVTRAWRLRYDTGGRLVRTTDPAGDVEELDYDGFGRVAVHRTANGSVARFEWDAGDRLLRHTIEGAHPDAQGAILLHEGRSTYDEGGRLIREEVAVFDPAHRAAGVQWSRREYVYDRADRVIELDGPGTLVQRLELDGLGRVTIADDQLGTHAATTFDDAARRADNEVTISGEGPDGPTSFVLRSSTRLDARGHVVSVIDGLGNESVSSYDSDGNHVATVDSLGVRSERAMGPDGSVDGVRIAVGRPDQCDWSYGYDPQRRLRTVDGPRGRVVELVYDAVGRAQQLLVAGQPVASYAYDDASRLRTTREPSGIEVTLDYGPASVIERRRFSVAARQAPTSRDALVATAVTYDYDGLGQLVSADDGHVPVARRYDSRGLLLSERTGNREVTWRHNLAGAAIEFGFSDGRTLGFDRGLDGRLATVRDGAAEVARVWPLGSGVIHDIEWRGAIRRTERRDGAGRLLSIDAVRLADDQRVARLEHLSDARGMPALHRLTLPASDVMTTYDLSAQGRIVGTTTGSGSAAVPDVDGFDATHAATFTQADHDAALLVARSAFAGATTVTAFTLDPDGARRARTDRVGGAATSSAQYTVSPTGLPLASGVAHVTDADGLVRSHGNTSMAYDDRRWLAAIAEPGAAPTVRVERDALGRVHRVVTATDDVELVHDGGATVELHRTGQPMVRVLRAPGSSLVLELQDGASRSHPFTDPDGTSLALLDTAGAVLARSGFDVFGLQSGAVGSWPPLTETFHGMAPLGRGLFLSPSRTYDANVGAFLEPDPMLTADGPNLHVFARGNPAAFTDPLGLMAQRGHAGGSGAPDGAWYGHGGLRPDTFLLRFLSYLGGALWTVWNGLTEPVKQVYDLALGTVGLVGDLSGWYHYEHRYASGIGQLAEQGKGTLDIFSSIGSGIAGIPGRWWDAVERGDYAALGAETMNAALLANALASPVASVGRYGFNHAVRAIGRTGTRGMRLQLAIRNWQVRGLGRAANGVHQLSNSAPRYFYSAAEGEGFGQFAPSRGGQIAIFEKAFTPSLSELFLTRAQLGGLLRTQGALAQFRFILNNGFRGNLAYRTAVHETWHYVQNRANPGGYRTLVDFGNQPYNPLEWTQPAGNTAWQLPGAYNMEALTPYGLWVQAAYSLQLLTGQVAQATE